MIYGLHHPKYRAIITVIQLLRGFLQCPWPNFVYWEEDGAWIGYFQEYPDYWTQGDTLDDLKEHLKDLYHDLTSGQLPGIRRSMS